MRSLLLVASRSTSPRDHFLFCLLCLSITARFV